MTEATPFVDLDAQRARLGPGLERAIERVLAHGKFIMGPEVGELETALADFAGVSEVVSCSSGTDALVMPLMAAGVGPGDAVIVPTFTFPASPEVVALLGATPVLTDVDPVTYNMSAEHLEAGIAAARDAGLRPVAAIAVDLFGLPADHTELAAVADAAGCWILSDAAQSVGATYQGRPVGGYGRCTATSFFPAKPLGCYGDGGAVLTDDPELADVLRSIRVHGQGASKYDIVRVGLNARLDTLQAAVLLEKLRIFPDEVKQRQEVADRYTAALDGVVQVPEVPAGRTSVWAQYTIQVDDRDGVAAHLGQAGVPTAVYYPEPLHQQQPYAACPRAGAALPAAEAVSRRVLSLPMHPYLDPRTQDRVVEALVTAVR